MGEGGEKGEKAETEQRVSIFQHGWWGAGGKALFSCVFIKSKSKYAIHVSQNYI